MPDHWHAIVLPDDDSSTSDFMMRVKISAYRQISKARGSREGIWQSRSDDHILRTRREFESLGSDLTKTRRSPQNARSVFCGLLRVLSSCPGYRELNFIGTRKRRVSLRYMLS